MIGWLFSVGLPLDANFDMTEEMKATLSGRWHEADDCDHSGRRILELQSSLALINSSAPLPLHLTSPDQYNRQPFRHPALDVSLRLDYEVKDKLVTHTKLANLGYRYGLLSVLRWKPRQVSLVMHRAYRFNSIGASFNEKCKRPC